MQGTSHHNLGNSLTQFFDSIQTKCIIKELDISSHQFGDAGAISLSKLLRRNLPFPTKLMFDNNNISLVGLNNLASGMDANTHIRCLPIPLVDLGNGVQANEVEAAARAKTWDQIQKVIIKNV